MKLSLSDLIQYVKNNKKANNELKAHLKKVNEKKGTVVTLDEVINEKQVFHFATSKERKKLMKGGSALFSTQILFNTASRMCEWERKRLTKLNNASNTSKSVWTVKNRTQRWS